MTTFMLLMTFATVLLFIPVIIGYRKHADMHHVDRMAGDEGED